MRAQPPGCLTPLGIIAMLITTVLIGISLWLQGGIQFSPGELSAASGPALGGVQSHQEIGGNCGACHTAPWSPESLSSRCLQCHTAIQAEMQNPATLHGSLIPKADQADCRACHTEHQGPQGNLTRANLAGFNHEVTGYSLKGHAAHASGAAFQCSDCHGERLTSIDQNTCVVCHANLDNAYTKLHLQTFGENCLDCHDGLDSYNRSFDHTRVPFALTGKHTPLPCQDCHAGSTTLQMLKNTPQDCAACHAKADAHQGQFGSNCAVCHATTGWKPASFDHARTSFPLTGAHQSAQCEDCHANHTYKDTSSACASCHTPDDPHQGQFGNDCAACHSTTAWKPASFDHALSNFPLTGAHQSVRCEACHANGVYKGTPSTCASCHTPDDPHQGQFGSDCAACHSTTAWKPATFDHALSNFPLTGAHIGVECTQCHQNNVFRGTATQCSACHQDPQYHAALLGSDCAACHTTTAWRPASYNGPHTFPINHEDANECRDCHPASLSTWTCYTCHDQGEMTRKHQEENIIDFSNCLECHADGGEPSEGGGESDGGEGGDD